MSQIDELQRRITAAMERIGQGLDGMSATQAPADAGELDAVKQELEDEKLTNAQLQERVNALGQKLEAATSDAAQHFEAQSAASTKLDAELGRLRRANLQLRTSNKELREANEAGVGEPHLINKAMLAELEALRATRSSEAAEAEAIMGALAPLIEAAASQQEEDA